MSKNRRGFGYISRHTAMKKVDVSSRSEYFGLEEKHQSNENKLLGSKALKI